MGSITGGPRDEDPPEVVSSKPVNYSTNFSGKRIEITFNEFITLNNVHQALVISPPITGRPDVQLRGKTLLVNLTGELRENTTYTLNFGSSIEDNNERNVLENFEFVFATGPYLDSLSVEGTILSAFDLKPSADPFIIMAYDKLEDSIPKKEIPVYIGRSDKEGSFRINNMKADTFRIFALKDLNYNYIYDLPNELIAFYDSLVFLYPEQLKPYVPDTITFSNDTLSLKEGKVELSVLKKKKEIRHSSLAPYHVDLFFFEEDNRIQYMTDYDRKEDRHFFLAFNLPIEENLNIKGLNIETEDWYYEEANLARDTFNMWITDTSLIKSDTLNILLTYSSTDSAGEVTTVKDTLNFISHRKGQPQSRRKIEELVKKSDLIVQTISNNSRHDLHKELFINFNYPVKQVDTTGIHLFSIPDSTEIPESISIREDSLSLRRRYLVHSWKSKLKYRLFIEPGTFTDIYGNVNDSIQLVFSGQDQEHYGMLNVNTTNVSCPMVIQLLDEKERFIEEKYIQSDSTVSFTYLKPGNYRLKYIYDLNDNRKWDTGEYLIKCQPEAVEYYDGEIAIRSNWEMEIKWKLRRRF